MKINQKKAMDTFEFGKISVNETLAKHEVSLWLDEYSDLFSDFDPRPYSQRTLSQDFLKELERATKELDPDHFTLILLMPKNLRKLEDESIIKKRLKEHFKKHALLLEQEHKKIVVKGILLTALGFVLMAAATYIYHYTTPNLFYSFLNIFFEPAGWFTVWYGLDHVFYFRKVKRPEFEFYNKMSSSEIRFNSY